METSWRISLIALWALVALNLVLTLRSVHWLRGMEDAQDRARRQTSLPLLPGTPAPDFTAKTLSGEPVQLADYAGRKVAFIFVSPHCGTCRHELPMLDRLGRMAAQRAGVELTLVSDSDESETQRWLQRIRNEDGVNLALPVLVSPVSSSNLFSDYIPGGIVPSFCVVEDGIVRATDPLGGGEWLQLQREWTAPRSAARVAGQLR
ncbi:MAG TPA: redoxin domain-containing protein [Micromonosporaceae bacterium]|nr:redoxin domain-containing protein [Micromonosporaceae bacterium]